MSADPPTPTPRSRTSVPVHFPDPSITLRFALVVPFALPIVAIVILTGWFSFRSGQNAVDDVATQLSQRVTESVENRVRAFADEPHVFLQINRAAVQTQNLDLQEFSSLERYFWQQVQLVASVNSFYYGDIEGNFILTRVNEVAQTYVRDPSTAPLREIYRLDDRGRRVELLSRSPYDPRERPWYGAAIEAGEATWSPVYPFAASPVLGITPVVPIFNETASGQAQLQGVMAVDITLEQLSNFLAGLKVSTSGRVYIIERSGELIASSADEPPFLEAISGERERLPATKSRDALISGTAQYLLERFGDLATVTQSQQLQTDINNSAHYLQVAPFSDGRGLNWLLVVAIPKADLMESVYAQARTTAWLCLLAIVAVMTTGVVAARWIARPISRLSRATDAIAQAVVTDEGSREWVGEVPVAGVREVRGLARSFNLMMGKLQESFAALEQARHVLEQRVESRTADLHQTMVRERQLLAQLERANQQLQSIANTDSLTQLSNRRQLDDYLNRIWQSMMQQSGTIALILCDIDFFKDYNDTYGHQAGDDCLQQVAAILQQAVKRPADLVARYGGEEFALVLPDTPLAGAVQVAERIQASLKAAAIPNVGSQVSQFVTLSCGIARVTPTQQSSSLHLLNQADRALYRAKSEGRNRMVCAPEALAESQSSTALPASDRPSILE
ncbi:MAG: diguanylate cyclase [Cyanobacteria bacterium P01_D01_bin.123]